MLKREVRPPHRPEEMPCVHKDITDGSVVWMILMGVALGLFFGGMIFYSAGYSRAFNQGYAGTEKVERAYDKGRNSCEP